MRSSSDDSGAAAVEFALILPLLALIFLGIVDFGRAFNSGIELSGGVREGARVMAVKNDVVAAQKAVVNAAPVVAGKKGCSGSCGVQEADVVVTVKKSDGTVVSPPNCSIATAGANATVTVRVNYAIDSIGPWKFLPYFNQPSSSRGTTGWPVSREAVMQCGG